MGSWCPFPWELVRWYGERHIVGDGHTVTSSSFKLLVACLWGSGKWGWVERWPQERYTSVLAGSGAGAS